MCSVLTPSVKPAGAFKPFFPATKKEAPNVCVHVWKAQRERQIVCLCVGLCVWLRVSMCNYQPHMHIKMLFLLAPRLRGSAPVDVPSVPEWGPCVTEVCSKASFGPPWEQQIRLVGCRNSIFTSFQFQRGRNSSSFVGTSAASTDWLKQTLDFKQFESDKQTCDFWLKYGNLDRCD